MKSAKEIINHLRNEPFFKKINDLERFYQILPENHKKFIAFMYVKDETILMMALKHPMAKKELGMDSNISFLKYAIKIFNEKNENSIFKNVNDIRFFVTNKIPRKLQENQNFQRKPIIVYEKSEGKFINNIADEEIHKIFEEIREIIIVNRRD